MKLWGWWRKKCGVCGKDAGSEWDVILYRVADETEVQSMRVCKPCGDELERGRLTPDDFAE